MRRVSVEQGSTGTRGYGVAHTGKDERTGERWLGPLVAALAVVLAGLLALSPGVQRLELESQDLRLHLRVPRAPQTHIVIAAITAETLERWKEPEAAWGSHYAAALRQARALGARCIGIDVIHSVS